MSWGSLGSSDGVSKGNLQDAVTNGIFVLKNTITGDMNDLVDKSDADFYVYVDYWHSSYVAKEASDIMVKENLMPAVCKILRVTTDFSDLAASDDFRVYFRFYDCNNILTTIWFDTTYLDHMSGYCYRNTSAVDVYILQSGVEQPALNSGYNDGGYCTLT